MIQEKAEAADLLLSSYDYELPEALIAQHPLDRRDASRMMVLMGHEEPLHRHISDILDYLKPGDCLLLNDTRVIPARLYGQSEGGGGKIEVLLLRRLHDDLWYCIGKPGSKMRPGHKIIFSPRLRAEVVSMEEDGGRILNFEYEGIWEELLDEMGNVPLPPYIHEKLDDPERYQTVYAERRGSAAAPTAGLHFTEALLGQIQDKGIDIAKLTLHVGLGTFRPVKETNVLDHKMHQEHYEISEECAEKINRAKRGGHRIICVGTTSCRSLETAADPDTGLVKPCIGETGIFIYPGFRFKAMDGLLTNFHLPQSTLLMLVSAFYGREAILRAYREAVREQYRFFSFGDCMLILPEKA